MARGYRFGVVGSISTVPDGKTVLPTDDIQIWLKCASIKDKAYTTLAQVLADSTTLQALISSNNAVDYMVRSTTWASGVTADSGAMTLIGANNYASNTLIDDSTWLNAICNSTYFESVLNAKVPKMTDDTTPSGECICNGYRDNSYRPYKAFDESASTYYSSNTNSKTTGEYIGYIFTSDVKVVMLQYIGRSTLSSATHTETLQVQCSLDGTNWDTIKDDISLTISADSSSSQLTQIFTNSNMTKRYRVYLKNSTQQIRFSTTTMQFYGRVDV